MDIAHVQRFLAAITSPIKLNQQMNLQDIKPFLPTRLFFSLSYGIYFNMKALKFNENIHWAL